MTNLIDLSDWPYAAGVDARRAGGHIGDCPYDHGTTQGAEWRQGWIEAEVQAREVTGQMQADTAAMTALASQDAESYPTELRLLLAEVDEATAPPTSAPLDFNGFTSLAARFTEAFERAAKTVVAVFGSIDWQEIARDIDRLVEAEHEQPARPTGISLTTCKQRPPRPSALAGSHRTTPPRFRPQPPPTPRRPVNHRRRC